MNELANTAPHKFVDVRNLSEDRKKATDRDWRHFIDRNKNNRSTKKPKHKGNFE